MKMDLLVRSGFFDRILSARGEFGYWVFEGDLHPTQRPSALRSNYCVSALSSTDSTVTTDGSYGLVHALLTSIHYYFSVTMAGSKPLCTVNTRSVTASSRSSGAMRMRVF